MVKNILVVEDSQSMIDIYKDFFKDSKYEVEYAQDAETAIKKIKAGKYDLFILDIIMEKVTGDSLLVRMRKQLNALSPVIIVSVLSEKILENLKEFGPIEFIQKPLTAQDLMERIARY